MKRLNNKDRAKNIDDYAKMGLIYLDTNIDYLKLLKMVEEDAMIGGIDAAAIDGFDGDLIPSDLPDEYDPIPHTNGATSASKDIFPKIQKYVSGKGGFFGKDDYTLAKNVFNDVQRRYKEQMKKLRKPKKNGVGIFCESLDEELKSAGLTIDDAIDLCKKYFEQKVKENGLDANLVNISFYGSRTKGTETDNSDLDCVIQYSGREREDTMFNILNVDDEEYGRFMVGNFIVDFNPIKSSMKEFLDKANQ